MGNKYLVLIALFLFAADQPKLVSVKVTKDITVSVPKEWRPMDELDFTQRYPSVRAPLAAYTNLDRTADFSVNISATQWPDANLALASRFFKASLANMFDRVTFIDEGIREVNKQSFLFFEFESRINGNPNEPGQIEPILKYTHVQFLVQPGRTLVFSFNCPRRDRATWEAPARAMMNSIKVK